MDRDPYTRRREALAEAMRAAGGGVAVVPTASEAVRNRDTFHPFRPDSYFHYLTGFAEPESLLVLYATGRSLLFCRGREHHGDESTHHRRHDTSTRMRPC